MISYSPGVVGGLAGAAACASFLTDILACDEDFASSNQKLYIMTFACVVALVAQFFPLDLTHGRLVVGACCALYFIASGVLQLIIFYLDGDIIYTSLPDKSRGGQFLVLRTGARAVRGDLQNHG